MNILIADDEEMIRVNFAKRIVKAKLPVNHIELASNGEEALKIMSQQQIDIALIDINMPFKNGLELIHEIRLINQDIILIIISGYNDFKYAQQALTEGVFRYLLKPVDAKEFIDVITLAIHKASQYEQDTHSPLVKRMVLQIQQNIANENYALSDLANSMQMSEGYITKLLKKELSKSFIDVLTEERIMHAKKLIRSQYLNMKMYEIAEACGYSNQYYFSQVFKRIVGVSPKQYSQNM